MSENLRVRLPFETPAPLHPTPTLTLSASLDRVGDVYTLVARLWPNDLQARFDQQSATAPSVSECIAEIGAALGRAATEPRLRPLRGPLVCAAVQSALREALLEPAGVTAGGD